METTERERVNLEQVLYMDYYNDIAVLVNGQFIMMIEHQSTINPNMPLRLLEYVSRIYGSLVDSKSKFSNQFIPWPNQSLLFSTQKKKKSHQKALETARTLLTMGLPPTQVAQGTSLPIETVQELMNS